jgi:hypothetical protein
MPSERRSARLVLDWAARHWAKWRTPPCPTQSWHGTEGSLLANSLDRQDVKARADERIDKDIEELIVRMVEENRSWGYDRIVGALANLARLHQLGTISTIFEASDRDKSLYSLSSDS